jgi:hypothetical protein
MKSPTTMSRRLKRRMPEGKERDVRPSREMPCGVELDDVSLPLKPSGLRD